jgi:hypothetical protein
MIKNILFAGKDFPYGEQFFSSARDAGLTALMTTSSEEENHETNPNILLWNKGSVVSAHSLVIQAENLVSSIDAACLIFDCPHFTSLYSENDTNSTQSIVCDLVLSYQLLAKALMDRFLLKKHGKLIFVLRASQTLADATKKHSEDAYTHKVVNPWLCAAQSAFISFAENFACVYEESAPEKVLLIKADIESDADISQFICRQLAIEEINQKKSIKGAAVWMPVSGKEERAFGFFKRF